MDAPADGVDVWAVDLARADVERNQLADVLSSDELLRAANMRVEAARRRYIVARSSARLLLGRYLGIDPAELEFARGEHGKPEIAGSALRFNVSHSGELCLIAVAREREIGIDVELIRRRRDVLRIARRYFTADENDAIERARDPESAFYGHWVAKEALLKATGLGLAGELRSFEVTLEPAPAIVQIGGDEREAARWSLELLPVASGYAAALVTLGPVPPSCVRGFDPLPLRRAG